MILSLIMMLPKLLLGTAAGGPVSFALAHPYYSNVRRDTQQPVFDNSLYPQNTSSPSFTLNNSSTLSLISITNDDNEENLPGIIASLLLFLLFVCLVFCAYFFGSSRLTNASEEEKPVGLGFGFDGLTKKELKAIRMKEEGNGKDGPGEWFVRLPEKPPALALIQELPLPPIEIHVERQTMKEYSRE